MENLYYALTHVDIQRVQTTLTIEDFDFITENMKYTFYNNGDKPVSILPLPARERKTQRNMKVVDSSNRDLVLIPSSSSTDFFVEACNHILEKASQHLNTSQKPAFEEIRKTIEPDIREIFTHESTPREAQAVCYTLSKVLERELRSKNFIREILYLIELLNEYRKGLYRPLIALLEPLGLQSYSLIHVSVERVKEYLQNRWERLRILLKFGVSGRFTFSFVPAIHPGISNHVRIYAPEGLVIKDIEFDFSVEDHEDKTCKKLENSLNNKKEDFFDKRLFYVQIGPEESIKMYECEAHFNITLGLNSLLSVFSLLWWLLILSPATLGLLQQITLLSSSYSESIWSSDVILTIIGLSITILAFMGAYSFNKKIIWHFITTQAILVYLIFTLEILLFLNVV